MENVIATLPARVSPEAVAAAAPVALKSGHLSIGFELVDMYAQEATDNTRINRLKAVAENATCEEFKAGCKDAQKRASEVDALAGFKAAEGAKGQDQYGPVRRVLNQRLSEAKQLFGVFKVNPDILKEKGYMPALNAARAYLKETGKNWDGTHALTDKEKSANKASAIQMQAIEQAMKDHPKEPGETVAQWLARCEEAVEQAAESIETEAFNKGVNKAREYIEKKFGNEMLMALLQNELDSMETETLEQLQNYIQEELVIRTLQQ